MSAIYNAAVGSNYNSKLASEAMGIVQDQYNALQDAANKRDAAAAQQRAVQQRAAQQRVARPAQPSGGSLPACQTGAGSRFYVFGACRPSSNPGPARPLSGNWGDFFAGLGSNIASLADAGCMVNPACQLERMLGVPSATQLYQRYVNKPLGINASSGKYKAGYWSGAAALLLIPGADEADAANLATRLPEITGGTRGIASVGKSSESGSVKGVPGDGGGGQEHWRDHRCRA